ncbi:MAG TPA: aminotransferase class V-fold PLP-dependent enzyme [Pyrinomonadaceae bacterium]|nr:aminotransferase class V-fold PLP-dependent enzyme [Pyrinomonadaceae bacterium]
MNRTIRASFPVALSGVYLNTAAVGPLPTSTVDAVSAQLNDVSENGSSNFDDWLETKERVRGLVASMLGGRASDVAFTRNTSDGLCAVASGLDWKAGDNIVSFASEFPANYYPWRTVRDRFDVELRLCRELNGRIDIDELCSLIDGRTRLVAVSAVQYSSGFRLDLERIGEVARSRGSLFAVDIIQSFGAMNLDLPSQFVDIAAGASYKWLCAPEGCGIFYINERARERVAASSHGWMSVEHPWNFCDRDQNTKGDARVWETGMGGTAMLCGLEASLRLLSETGLDSIAKYLSELTDFLCEIAPTTRYDIVSSRADSEKSQIVCLRPLNGRTSDEIVAQLKREQITVSSRCGLLRVAPHFFNTFDDIETFVEALP